MTIPGDSWDDFLDDESSGPPPVASAPCSGGADESPGAALAIPPSVAPPPVLSPTSPSPALAKQQEVQERLRVMEQAVLEDSLTVISSALHFHEVLEPDGSPVKDIPQDWIERFGEKGARERFIIARSACMSAKEAPVGLKMAQQTAVGAMAALEKSKTAGVTFNLQFVKMVQPAVYEEIEVTVDSD